MASAIDPNVIGAGNVSKEQVRAQLEFARLEISALQALLAPPVGALMPFAGSTAPARYLLCTGQAVSRLTYSALFAVIGTTYGIGDNTTTFNVPDLRGRAVFGVDGGANRLTTAIGGVANALGATGGDERLHAHLHPITPVVHAHNIIQNAHTHGVVDPGHAHSVFDPGHIHGGLVGSSGTHSHEITGDPANGTAAGVDWKHLPATPNSAGSYGSTNAAGEHTHGINILTNTTNVGINGSGTGVTLALANAGITATEAVSSGITGTNNSGAGGSQNVPPAIALNYIIAAGV